MLLNSFSESFNLLVDVVSCNSFYQLKTNLKDDALFPNFPNEKVIKEIVVAKDKRSTDN